MTTTARLVRDDPSWRFPGFHGTTSVRRLRVWRVDVGRLVAVLTEGMHDPGTSITNAAEKVAARLADDYPDDVIEVVEHYPAADGDRFDGVELLADGEPRWWPIRTDELVARLGPALLRGVR